MQFDCDPQRMGADVINLLAGAEAALIIAPFITKVGLRPILEVIASGGRVDIVTRWEPTEIKAGVSDPSIIEDVIPTGGSVRLLPRLHAKVYAAGAQALVGSANPTGPGLGFVSPANVEILVPVPFSALPIRRLMQVIDASAARATSAYAKQLIEYAATLPEASAISTDVSSRTIDWIPETMVPSRVLELYMGGDKRDDYVRDLRAINPPSGLSREGFMAHAAIMLQQGLVGRIYQDCEGLFQWQGVERMRNLLSEAGSEAEDPMTAWNRLLNWFKFYLSAVDGPGGGYSILRS